mmetsp:Transcript_6075/g.12029  ORF Transcript_6075/g.12029 Transcript_6075/m.12029 type:complete len:260 (+) Transcript_6075:291-1070(+)
MVPRRGRPVAARYVDDTHVHNEGLAFFSVSTPPLDRSFAWLNSSPLNFLRPGGSLGLGVSLDVVESVLGQESCESLRVDRFDEHTRGARFQEGLSPVLAGLPRHSNDRRRRKGGQGVSAMVENSNDGLGAFHVGHVPVHQDQPDGLSVLLERIDSRTTAFGGKYRHSQTFGCKEGTHHAEFVVVDNHQPRRRWRRKRTVIVFVGLSGDRLVIGGDGSFGARTECSSVCGHIDNRRNRRFCGRGGVCLDCAFWFVFLLLF